MRVCYAFGWCVVFKKRYPMLDKLGQIVWQTRQHCLIILILIFHFVPSITFYRVSNSLVRSADAFLLILSFAFHFIWQRNVLPLSLPPSLPLSLSLCGCVCVDANRLYLSDTFAFGICAFAKAKVQLVALSLSLSLSVCQTNFPTVP